MIICTESSMQHFWHSKTFLFQREFLILQCHHLLFSLALDDTLNYSSAPTLFLLLFDFNDCCSVFVVFTSIYL